MLFLIKNLFKLKSKNFRQTKKELESVPFLFALRIRSIPLNNASMKIGNIAKLSKNRPIFTEIMIQGSQSYHFR